jgi:hypothetical protein
MAINNKLLRVAMIYLILFLSACTRMGTKDTTEVPTPTIFIPTPTYLLATPYAQSPAAGICASFDGDLVVVNIYLDIPDPRCIKVRADQRLSVVNQTKSTLEISLGIYKASLLPGAETTFDAPFGMYLATGVHQLQVSPCCGPELVLEENN